MFSEFDFLSGEVRWMDTEPQEDMLQVNYSNNYILDMGWYESINSYVIYIIKDFEWGVPVAKYSASTVENMKILLHKAIEKIESESSKGKSYYGALWKTEVETL